LLTFWSGAVPRLARLIMSGGIVFTMFVENKSSSSTLSGTNSSKPGMRRQWRLSTLSTLRENTYDAGTTCEEVVDAFRCIYVESESSGPRLAD
jgi:hypothetical protein